MRSELGPGEPGARLRLCWVARASGVKSPPLFKGSLLSSTPWFLGAKRTLEGYSEACRGSLGRVGSF